MNDRFYGLDSLEVIKVLNSDEIENSSYLGGNEKTIYAHTLLDPGGQYVFQTALILRHGGKNKGLFYIPRLEDFIDIDAETIIPLPGYLKQQQVPFFVWGVVDLPEKLVILITFDYFFS